MDSLCVRDGQRFLFIGDSITDAGRSAEARPYGNGYVSLFIELQQAMFPRRCIEYVNKGIGGNTVRDLQNRWEDDVVREHPDWLAVKIGINDCNRHLAGMVEHGPEAFREDYDAILAAARKKTRARLVLIDPFYISRDRTGLGSRSEVLQLLPRYIAAVRDMAGKYRAKRVRTHDMFQKQLRHVSPDFFCPEPVHPYRSGHLCIALEVMKVLTA